MLSTCQYRRTTDGYPIFFVLFGKSSNNEGSDLIGLWSYESHLRACSSATSKSCSMFLDYYSHYCIVKTWTDCTYTLDWIARVSVPVELIKNLLRTWRLVPYLPKELWMTSLEWSGGVVKWSGEVVKWRSGDLHHPSRFCYFVPFPNTKASTRSDNWITSLPPSPPLKSSSRNLFIFPFLTLNV